MGNHHGVPPFDVNAPVRGGLSLRIDDRDSLFRNVEIAARGPQSVWRRGRVPDQVKREPPEGGAFGQQLLAWEEVVLSPVEAWRYGEAEDFRRHLTYGATVDRDDRDGVQHEIHGGPIHLERRVGGGDFAVSDGEHVRSGVDHMVAVFQAEGQRIGATEVASLVGAMEGMLPVDDDAAHVVRVPVEFRLGPDLRLRLRSGS